MIAVAKTEADVPALIRWARENRIPITPRGSGSSMANGAIGAGVVLDLSRLNTIGPVDPNRGRVHCGAGTVRDAINRTAGAHGLRFPVDPSSGAFCTIGGMVATNAAGARSLGFGATRVWVRALDCAFADGSRATLRRGVAAPVEVDPIARALRVLERFRSESTGLKPRVRKNSSGYGMAIWAKTGDLLDVIIGSEGTLAIVTGVELKLAPVPVARGSLLAAFEYLDAAAVAASGARDAGVVVCELLDRTFLDVAREGGRLPELPDSTAAVLLIEIEAPSPGEVIDQAASIERTLVRVGAVHTTVGVLPAEEREIWELRHAASPILARLDPALRSVQVIEDAAVPPEHLGAYIGGVRAALARHSLRGVIFGHAGDAHVHVNPLVDVSAPGWRERLDGVLGEVTELVARLGGTLSGEHGDGRLRAPLLERTWSPVAMEAFVQLKQAFDPEGILNPGVKLPLPGQTPIEEVKYDPELPSLPSKARAALDYVTENRAYAESRLRLLERDY